MFFIDCRRGASGDMLLGALIDLSGASFEDTMAMLERIGGVMGPTKVSIERVQRQNGMAVMINVEHGPYDHMKAADLTGYLEAACDLIGLSGGKTFAMEVLSTLVEAEAHVHDRDPEDLVLHETGCPDTLVDIVGVAHFHEELGMYEEDVLSTRIGVGKGRITIAHGEVEVPPPATMRILEGMDWEYGPLNGELTTPTGAALLKNMVTGQIEGIPKTEGRTGRGTGTLEHDGVYSVVEVKKEG